MNLSLISEPHLAPRSLGESLATGLGLSVYLPASEREGEDETEREGFTKRRGEGGRTEKEGAEEGTVLNSSVPSFT